MSYISIKDLGIYILFLFFSQIAKRFGVLGVQELVQKRRETELQRESSFSKHLPSQVIHCCGHLSGHLFECAL